MNEKDLAMIVEKLVREKEYLESDLLGSYKDGADDVGDDADLATSIANKEFNLSIKNRINSSLFGVVRALKKLDNGSYGICENCEEDIELNRLKARPTSELCILCKELEESAK
jgi:DnaK suppressor protein